MDRQKNPRNNDAGKATVRDEYLAEVHNLYARIFAFVENKFGIGNWRTWLKAVDCVTVAAAGFF